MLLILSLGCGMIVWLIVWSDPGTRRNHEADRPFYCADATCVLRSLKVNVISTVSRVGTVTCLVEFTGAEKTGRFTRNCVITS
jgi:hypothetical protein